MRSTHSLDRRAVYSSIRISEPFHRFAYYLA
jgi:hypothetical protein